MTEGERSDLNRWSRPRTDWISRLWHASVKIVLSNPMMGMSALFLAGILFWGAFNWSLEVSNTEQFCVSCHVMRQNVYEQYKQSSHAANRTGVRASCPDCHVPREWIHKVARKVAATNELFHWMVRTIDTPEKFEAKKLELARHVWQSMSSSNSRECRNCHEFDSMSAEQQIPKTYLMHGLAEKWETTCIECHQGVVHSLPAGFDREAVMDNLHVRMEKEKMDCHACHEDMVRPPAGEEW